MARPLLRHTVGELEELFVRSKTDERMLRAIVAELEHRNVPRAVTLLEKIKKVLAAITANLTSSEMSLLSSDMRPPRPTLSISKHTKEVEPTEVIQSEILAASPLSNGPLRPYTIRRPISREVEQPTSTTVGRRR